MSQSSGKTLQVMLTKESPITEKTIHDLDTLFSIVTPGELRNNLLHLYFHYIIHMDLNGLPLNFKDQAENINFLQNFLNEADLNKK